MSDHNYEDFVLLENGHRFDIGQSYGVCDLSYSQFDEVGNLTAFFYEQMDPEQAVVLISKIAQSVFSAKSFHAEVVAQLRADQNGAHADGEA